MFVSLTPRAFGLFALFGVLFGFSIHGLSIHGFSIQGFSSQGFNIQSFSIQVIERMGGFSPPSQRLVYIYIYIYLYSCASVAILVQAGLVRICVWVKLEPQAQIL